MALLLAATAPVLAAEAELPDTDEAPPPTLSAKPPAPGEVPSGAFIAQVYDAANRGTDLYRQKRYKEALPHLLVAARRGFKWPQALAGDIYLHGRGEVPADLEAGIGWLGVAAQQRTSNSIARFYKELLERFTDDAVEEIVSDYRSNYSNKAHRVACRFDVDEGRSSSLRRKSLRCRFIDEGTQCRDLGIDPWEGLGGEVSSRWTCQPLSGTRSIDMRRN